MDKSRGQDWEFTKACRAKIRDETAFVQESIVKEHPKFTLGRIRAELRRCLPNLLPIDKITLNNLLARQLVVMKKIEDALRERNTLREG